MLPEDRRHISLYIDTLFNEKLWLCNLALYTLILYRKVENQVNIIDDSD